MSLERKIRERLHEQGFKSKYKDFDILGVELSVCQFIVVVLSIISIVFLFVPLFFLKSLVFFVIFFALSIVCLIFGVWFWIKRADICEHPEDYEG